MLDMSLRQPTTSGRRRPGKDIIREAIRLATLGRCTDSSSPSAPSLETDIPVSSIIIGSSDLEFNSCSFHHLVYVGNNLADAIDLASEYESWTALR